MLDDVTKRRINSARDILVGKLPDPKSQVEQITIALIYKFMDDMDRQAEALPRGKAKFFAGEFKKHAWRNIFSPQMGGHDVVALYGEAIQTMNQNPNVPQLFRDIFKNAYLPYRDPETLKSFLKEINEFEYDHSERLGDAFEYLLSVLGSQGDAGQFRTPRNIIDFMVEILEPKKNEKILDPACGTAGFLISAYKHIIKHNSKNYDPNNDPKPFELQNIKLSELTVNGKGFRGEKLTSDDRKRLVENISGYDISPDMVRLSLVNMYLHGFSNPKIYEYDTLSRDDKWDEKAEVILANPPFMSPKGGIKPHSRFSVPSNRSEVLFVDYMAEHLTSLGRAAIIVPEGVVFQVAGAYKQLRKMLVDEKYLVGVISLPAGLFNPYSGVKTSILWLDKQLAKKTDKILFVKIENDGFDLGAQRRPIKENDLPDAYKAIMEYKESLMSGKHFKEEAWQKIKVFEKNKIAKDGDYSLSGERYVVAKVFTNVKWPIVELGEICEIGAGNSAPQDPRLFSNGKYPFFRTSDVGAVHRCDDLKQVNDWLNEEGIKGLKLFSRGTILFPKSGASTFLNHRVIMGFDGYVSSHLATICPNPDKILSKYVYYFLLNVDAKQLTPDQAYPSLKTSEIARIKIPLPPISIQEEIVAELDGYQKIVSGARQVVECYRPGIDVDSSWPEVRLEDVCEINPPKSKISKLKGDTNVSFVPMSDINENQMLFEVKQCKKLDEVLTGYTYFEDNDVLLAKVTPCFENGKAGIAKNLVNGVGFGSSELYVLRPSRDIRSEWIYFNVITNDFRRKGQLRMTGTGGLQRIPKDFVQNFKILLPKVDVQNAIICKIEKEQQVVRDNEKLIDIFDRRIQGCIAKVWGEK